MSASQFPLEWPTNVNFSTLNILDPVPPTMVEVFDVIHIRFLVLGLPKGTWGLACTNLLKLLKPGGWLQWDEADYLYVV
jgi:chemotaxis methyl-accepting protein methylase